MLVCINPDISHGVNLKFPCPFIVYFPIFISEIAPVFAVPHTNAIFFASKPDISVWCFNDPSDPHIRQAIGGIIIFPPGSVIFGYSLITGADPKIVFAVYKNGSYFTFRQHVGIVIEPLDIATRVKYHDTRLGGVVHFIICHDNSPFPVVMINILKRERRVLCI